MSIYFVCRSDSCALVSPAKRVLVRAPTIAEDRPTLDIDTLRRDSDDSPWSTFRLDVGTPAQQLRVHPSNSESSVWTVLSQGCIASDPSNCASLRGWLYNPNASSTWSYRGLYGLPIYEEDLLGNSGNGEFGFYTVTLGWPGGGAPTLLYQVVAGIVTKDFYLEILGLTARSFNFTGFDNPYPSVLGSLKDNKTVSSSTWAYTAGAHYLETPTFGSLTFGGYDSTRMAAAYLTVNLGEDISRDLLLGSQSITSSKSLLPSGIMAFIDSTMPHIWLPLEACLEFESAFGLVYDSATDLYLVNDTLHKALLAQNPNVTFQLSADTDANSGASLDIVLPYGAIDLKGQLHVHERWFILLLSPSTSSQ